MRMAPLRAAAAATRGVDYDQETLSFHLYYYRVIGRAARVREKTRGVTRGLIWRDRSTYKPVEQI